jgi:hypothetical protein
MFIKKGFSFSEPFFAFLTSKFEKSSNMTFKKFFAKIKKGLKNAEFHADLKSIKKVLKNFISKIVNEICTFSTFTHVHQTCLAYNFFWCLFYNFFNGFEISMKFCVF